VNRAINSILVTKKSMISEPQDRSPAVQESTKTSKASTSATLERPLTMFTLKEEILLKKTPVRSTQKWELKLSQVKF
jgi:hypothetical protein